MSFLRNALRVLLPGVLAGAAFAQTGTLDQTSVAANATFNTTLPSLTWQQQVEVGIGGTLEGFELTSVGTIGGSFDVSIRLGPLSGPTAPMWSTTYVRTFIWEETPYFDVTAANLNLSPGDKFIIEVTGNGMGACDLRGNGLNPPGYSQPLWLNGGPSGGSVFAFRTWMLQTVGLNFCTSEPNSTGMPAVISALGSGSIAANDTVLMSGPGPVGEPGIFFYGPNEIMVPFGNGFRCVGGMTVRLQPPVQHDASGFMTRALDVNNLPPGASIVFGDTWKFQSWFRDPAGGGAGFDLSDGLSVFFNQ